MEMKNLGTAFSAVAREWAHTPFPMYLGMAILLAGGHWDGHLQSQQGCFVIQQIDGRAYKVDTCTGRIEALPEVSHADLAKLADLPPRIK